MNLIVLDPPDPTPPPPPRRRKTSQSRRQPKPDRACDFCRKRKTKCDGPSNADRICSNCRSSKLNCTYVETSKPRGPPKAYITTLENKVHETERLIKRLFPDLDLLTELGPAIERDSWKDDFIPASSSVADTHKTHGARSSRSPDVSLPTASTSTSHLTATVPSIPTSTTRSSASPPVTSHSGDKSQSEPLEEEESEDDGEGAGANRDRYLGKSSSHGLVQATMKVKQEWDNEFAANVNHFETDIPEYETRSWQELLPLVPFDFPPPDLCNSLIDLYFTHINPYFPLLHRPTFEAQYKSALHMRDRAFAAMFLTLLAVSSRWSDDPRVLAQETPASPDQPSKPGPKMSSGWPFFLEAAKYQPTASAPACLFDVQRFALSSSFLRWTRHAPSAWNMVGLAIRLAQDLGAHRKKRYGPKPTVEDELWKRAFWLLVVYDRIGSASLGRPCCVREEDFDLDLPLEVDDEYWIDDDPDFAFRQPPGKPSQIAHINSFIKLTTMMAFTLRTVYCIDKTKVLLGLVGPTWRERVIQQLNAAMEEWTETLPSHLRWGPGIEKNHIFSMQSATLYTTYYLLLQLIYRPFIPPPKSSREVAKSSGASEYPFPALAICVSAARAGVRIVEAQMSRGHTNVPNMIAVAHLCGALLLLNVWELKKQDECADVKSLLRDVKTCLKALELCGEKWEAASNFYDSLRVGLPEEYPASPQPVASITDRDRKDALDADRTQVQPRHLGPAKPPKPPGASDYPHERAMQPPKLTDGWHWFSQVGIGPGYQSPPQTPPVEMPRVQSVLQSAAHLKGSKHDTHQTTKATSTHTPLQISQSYQDVKPPISASFQTPVQSASRHPSSALAIRDFSHLVMGEQVPWWLEKAMGGRPAYHDGTQLSAGTLTAEQHWQQMNLAGGTVKDWERLAEPSYSLPLHPSFRADSSTSSTYLNAYSMFTSTNNSSTTGAPVGPTFSHSRSHPHPSAGWNP